MQQVFGYLSMGYEEDSSEPNDSASEADWIIPDAPALELTLFSDPEGDGVGSEDTDVFRFDAVSEVAYAIETSGLLSQADTYLELLDTNGSTVLASNGDTGTGNPASRINWTATGTGVYYVRVTNESNHGNYGAYRLEITTP
jgi:hypothetical protein